MSQLRKYYQEARKERNKHTNNPLNLKSKVCRTCGKEKSISEFHVDRAKIDGFRGECKECSKRYSKANWHKYQETNRRCQLKRDFGISLQEYDRLFAEQNGVCAICNQPDMTGRRLAVDHDHKTGKIRGLLCNVCNMTLGRIQENVELLKRMIVYLS